MTFWCRRNRVRAPSPATRHARQARARDGRLHHGLVRGDLDPGAAVRARSPSRGGRGAVRRTEPVRRDDRRHGLRADLHPAFRHRPAAARASDRPRSRRTARFPPATARPSCSEPPTTASGSGWPRRSSIAPTWPTTRGSPPTPAAARTETSSTRPSDPGAPQHDLAEIQKVADDAGIGNSRYNLPSEVVVHPQLTARDRWRTVGTSKGDIQALRPPPVISGFEQPMGAVPGLGEHTDAVLGGIGVDCRRDRPAARRRSDRACATRERTNRCC